MFRASALFAVTAVMFAVPGLRAGGPPAIDPASYDYVLIKAPFGSPSTYTNLLGLNDRGQIVGFWYDPTIPGGDVHPFLYDDGRFVDLDPHLAGVRDTRPLAINNKGQVVGTYRINEQQFPFLYEDGLFTTLPVPNGSPSGINDRGDIVGSLFDSAGTHGFLYSRGVLTLIDVPDVYASVAADINNRGQVVGYYRTTPGATNPFFHGFEYDRGRFTLLDVPFFTPPDTTPRGINARGQVVGSSFEWVSGRPVMLHGFFYDSGRFVRFDVGRDTSLRRINARGQIIGNFADDTGLHDFLATPKSN